VFRTMRILLLYGCVSYSPLQYYSLQRHRTGPAAQHNLMGYARAGQTAHGIHQRLRARAFIIAEQRENANDPNKAPVAPAPAAASSNWEEDSVERIPETKETLLKETQEASYWDATTAVWSSSRQRRRRSRKDLANESARFMQQQQFAINPNTTVCFVSIDAGMGSDLLNMRVLKRLDELAEIEENGGLKGLCRLENLSISGTHTHSAPAGFLQYTLYQITSLGFSEEVIQTFTEGVAQAILKAYRSLQPGTIDLAQGLLFDANINRSPSSYLLNPEAERNEYAAEGDTDKNMVQLSFSSREGGDKLGLLNWFAVHGTSMNASNQLISGDNKGYASYLADRYFNGNDTITGKGSFVAAFASTNLGDVSPNTAGPRCIDTGLPCDLATSTCNGNCMNCIASGPGKTQLESTEIIGRKQFEHSMKLLNDNDRLTSVTGAVAFRHSFLDMAHLNVTLEDGNVTHTCPAALGYSFAGGTTDGPGDFTFQQGTNTSNPFWNNLGGFLSIPTKEQVECQSPKPILLNVGMTVLPYRWAPNTVPISIFRVGQFFILNVPGEFTTMAGRRLRKAVHSVLVENGIDDPVVTIAGLANSYAHYITTVEEYTGQRYEAASTIYGPHTLSAYIQEFERIATDLLTDQPSESAESPKDISNKQISLIPPVPFDMIGVGRTFGSLAIDAKDQYRTGETVGVSFRSANPRSNQRIEDTFLTVDFLDNDTGEWQTRYVDSDWCTQFHWKGGIEHWGVSFAEVFWTIPPDSATGLYRICHYGTRKTLIGELEMFLYRVPAWLTTNVFGSYAVNMVLQSLRFAVHLSRFVRKKTDNKLAHSRLRDFEGCSRTFLVH